MCMRLLNWQFHAIVSIKHVYYFLCSFFNNICSRDQPPLNRSLPSFQCSPPLGASRDRQRMTLLLTIDHLYVLSTPSMLLVSTPSQPSVVCIQIATIVSPLPTLTRYPLQLPFQFLQFFQTYYYFNFSSFGFEYTSHDFLLDHSTLNIYYYIFIN